MKHLIIELREETQELLTKYAGLKQDDFDYLFSSLDTLSNKEMEKLWDVLQSFRAREYAELYRIFRLPLDNSPNGPELWDRLLANTNRANNYPEVKLLRKQARVCRDAWKLLIKTFYPNRKKEQARESINEKQGVDDRDPESAQSLPV